MVDIPVTQIDPTVLTDQLKSPVDVSAIEPNIALSDNSIQSTDDVPEVDNPAVVSAESTSSFLGSAIIESDTYQDTSQVANELPSESETDSVFTSEEVTTVPEGELILVETNTPFPEAASEIVVEADLEIDGGIVSEPLVHQTESDSQVVFDSANCVLVGDGSFYCQQPTTDASSVRPDGVYAYPDRDGDLEIYIQRDGELQQITFNQVDDASPWYDATSNTIVWHRLIEGRYYIISYDVVTGVESQLTTASTNNMEPTRQGSFTVWQSWLDNNWEIILFDGTEMYRITHSSEPDIAPQIRNGLLLWSRLLAGGDRVAEVYNIQTKERITIEDGDNQLISNARMMIVFDSQTANGDVVVKGYDIITGEIIPISNQARPVPTQIPDPNPIGEPTALFPPNTKSDITTDDTDVPSGPPDETDATTTPIYANDFDDEATLVLFDYGLTSSTPDAPLPEEVTVPDEDFTLDLRSPDPLAGHTLEIPTYEEPATTTDESLSSQN